ncbi:MAG: protein TolR [Deltaproteobacteria bacterium]|nr:protein TolR [Deltaproteobacteria bacterium]
MAFSSGSGGGSMSDINVTPLVDVMLVLLIIFMVTTPLMEQGIQVDLPRTKAQALTSQEQKLVLTVTKERRVYLGKTEIPEKELLQKLKANERVKKEREVYLHADQALPYGVVVNVMGVLKQAGVETLGMVTDPMGDAPP